MIVEIQRRTHVQQMTYQDFEERIRDGDIPPETLVRFEVVTGEQFRPVGELELYAALADPQRMAFRRQLTRPGMPLVTALLVGVQIRIYLFSCLTDVESWLEKSFTNWAPAIIEQGQVYRLVTYGLLQTSFTHLLFNLYFLAYTAYHLERAVGRGNLTLIYFGSVFTGGLLSMVMAPERPSLGASGGVFGLLAAVVILGWKHWENLPRSARKYFGWALAPYLGFSILSGLTAENVDNWGHLGGLVGGSVLMIALDPELLPNRQAHNTRTRQIALGALLATSLGVLLAGTRLVPLSGLADPHGWRVSRPTQWREGWTFTGDRGWFSPTLRAGISVASTVHARPLPTAAAAQNLIDRIDSGGKHHEVVSQEAVTVQGWPGQRLVIRFDLSGEEQQMTALVVVRGVYEYRVQFQSLLTAAGSYQPLIERVLSSVVLLEPTELAQAQQGAQYDHGSFEKALQLGDALYRAGAPEEALRSYRHALGIDPADQQALVGLLRVHADYDVPGGVEAARQALAQAPDEVRVIEAAAEVLLQEGQRDEAFAILEETWRRMPENRILRGLRLQWGLPVEDLPPAP